MSAVKTKVGIDPALPEGERTVVIAYCPVCGRRATRQHPCRFEIACSCWRGVPCDGSGKVKRR